MSTTTTTYEISRDLHDGPLPFSLMEGETVIARCASIDYAEALLKALTPKKERHPLTVARDALIASMGSYGADNAALAEALVKVTQEMRQTGVRVQG